MFWRSVSLKNSGRLVVRVTMAYNNQASKDNGVQGSQFSNDRSHQNYGNNPRPRGSYPHGEGRGNGRDRGQGRGYRNDKRDRAQPFNYHGDTQKFDRDRSHQQRVQPGPDQSDSQKGDRTQGRGQLAQSGPNQGDSQKGDTALRNSMKSDMAQGYRQGAEPDSYQGDSHEGSDGAQGHGQGAEPFSYQGDSQEGSDGAQGHGQRAELISYQGDTQENIDRGQHDENDSRPGFQAVFDQKDLQKGTEGDMAQGLEQGIDKGDSQEVKPFSDQKISQEGKEWNHAQGASSSKGNLKEGNDMCQSYANNSIQKTQPGFHQKDSQKGSDRVQSHGNDSGSWKKHGPNQGSWRKGEYSSVGHYQDNRSHSYQGQKDSGHEGRYSRQASSGGGSRRDNSDQQQWKRNRVDEEDDIFLSKTLSFILRHGAEKLKFKLMPGGFLYVDEILKNMQELEGFTVNDVLKVVAQNDMQRFAIQDDGTGRLKIRANQGHTVEVEDLELTTITSADQVPMVLHGTYYDAWNSIKKQGLCRFKHNHIHFAAGEPGENGVISGKKL